MNSHQDQYLYSLTAIKSLYSLLYDTFSLGFTSMVVSEPDEIAWLFNLRGEGKHLSSLAVCLKICLSDNNNNKYFLNILSYKSTFLQWNLLEVRAILLKYSFGIFLKEIETKLTWH